MQSVTAPSLVDAGMWLQHMQSNPFKQLQLRGHDDEITAFAMSPNGALLATGQKGSNSDVIIWSTQKLTQQYRQAHKGVAFRWQQGTHRQPRGTYMPWCQAL